MMVWETAFVIMATKITSGLKLGDDCSFAFI